MYRVCIYCGIAEVSRTTPCLGSAGHWFNNVPATPTFANVIQCPQCQRGEPCGENLRLTLEAENALLKKKLAIASNALTEAKIILETVKQDVFASGTVYGRTQMAAEDVLQKIGRVVKEIENDTSL